VTLTRALLVCTRGIAVPRPKHSIRHGELHLAVDRCPRHRSAFTESDRIHHTVGLLTGDSSPIPGSRPLLHGRLWRALDIVQRSASR